MKMTHVNYLTEDGLKKMKDELHLLKTKERSAISKQIAEARDKGDLSENAEYDAAKDAQGLLELKISKMESFIANAKVVDETKLDTNQVHILCKVKIKNIGNSSTTTYQLVPENETDIKKGKISIESPIAKGLIGKKKGDKIEVQVPSGKMKFEILDIKL